MTVSTPSLPTAVPTSKWPLAFAGSSTSGLSMQPFTLPVPSVQAMSTPAGPPPATRRVMRSRSSLSMEPIRVAPVSRRPSAALQVALVV